MFESTGWVAVELAQPVAVVRYALTSANDAPGRDPQDWTLEGSQDGQSWTVLDTQTGQSFGERFQTREYAFSNSTAYRHYRLNVTRNHGDGILQLAELQLSKGGENPPPAPEMRSMVGAGPTERLQRQVQGRLDRRPRAAVRRRAHGRRPRLLLQQGLRRQRQGQARHRALLPDLPRVRARRPALPEHVRVGRPRVHRRHVPARAPRHRPARRAREPARPGRLQDALHQPVEPQGQPHRRRGGGQDGRPHPRRLRQPRRAGDVRRLDRRRRDRGPPAAAVGAATRPTGR